MQTRQYLIFETHLIKISESKFFIWFLIFTGAFLRIIHLGQRSFRMDEGFVAQLVKQDLPVLITGSFQNTVPLLFTLPVHFFYLLFGDSQFVLSIFPMICGTLLIYPVYLIGKNFFSVGTGTAAAFLTAISPYHIFISQELRPYSLLCLLSLVSAYLFIKILLENRRKMWYFLLLCNIAILFTHITGWFIIVVENIVFFIYLRQTRQNLKVWLVVQSISMLFYLPFIILSTDILKYAFSCFTALYDPRTSSFDFSKFLKIPLLGIYYTAGFSFPVSKVSPSNFISNPLQVIMPIFTWILSTCCFLYGIYLIKKRLNIPGAIISLLCIISFILAAFPGGSILYLHVGAAAFLIIIAFSISRLNKLNVYLAFAGLILISAFSLKELYSVPYNTYDSANYIALVNYIEDNIGPEEIVYFAGSVQCCHTWLYYYQGKTIFQHPDFTSDNFNLTMNYEIRDEKFIDNLQTPVEDLLNDFHKVWVVLSLDSKRQVREKLLQVFSDVHILLHNPDYAFTVAEVSR